MGSVTITRANDQLGRTKPTEDAVICLLVTGTAVAGKIALSDPKQIFGTADLATLGITAGNNPLAYKDITDFYAKAGEGAELNIMLVSDATSLTNMCDKANNVLKKLIDFTNGRAVVVLVNKKAAAGYTVTLTNGLDGDVWTAVAKLNEMAADYDAQNIPFVGVLPAFGFASANIADIPLRSTQSTPYVGLNFFCEKNDGLVSQGILAGWLAKHQVNQNVGRVASGKVADTAYWPDGTTWLSLKASVVTLAGKGLIVPQKIGGRSGFYFFDDPTLTPVDGDYTSLSWNRVINKAKRIAYDKIVDKLNDDVDVNPNTGKIETSLASDWESEVETAIRDNMMVETGTRKKEINGVKCSVDPDSDVANDEVDLSLRIVRKGQAKDINMTIMYSRTV